MEQMCFSPEVSVLARFLLLFSACVFLLVGAGAVAGKKPLAVTAVNGPRYIAGPVQAHLVRVVDGDTIDVVAHIWLQQSLRIRVRLRGIDAPELHGRCDKERLQARRAARQVQRWIGPGRLELYAIGHGKYARRVIARVKTQDGRDLGIALLAAGLARKYRKRRRISWCHHRPGRENAETPIR